MNFVLPVPARDAVRRGAVDLYHPDDVDGPAPGVLIVHGGPIPAGVRPAPRDWPVFRAYASLLAARGLTAAVVDHELHEPAGYPASAANVRVAVGELRADPRVDSERVALWFFSGGGLLSADYLARPPVWLRAVALSCPVLEPLPGWPVDARFRPVAAVTRAGGLPIVLTRVGRERPDIAPGVRNFVAAAPAGLEIIDVPDGHHGFDTVDDDASRTAVTAAVDRVRDLLAAQ
ncbi:S9 family peptidase [Actinoplanes sp. N902-109]|uniref:alpha/beta hydrolase family protein n=1 Tax=Actinoplanes sp. (strain N902-109) TaxID=649831 RepID=UPI0003294526|nr:hypothetical protein [Actinoplanes sp. N902-109]AGL17321.1 hypothetical protein L083_3811 [Actinoplanes sp. N902-109]